jgi:TfoX/Sxy family transcriptional regulator of competence genes
MAYDENLAARIRARIGPRPDVTERHMFGGIAFLLAGNMAVGVHDSELLVRVGKDAHSDALTRRGARTFDLSARPMQGWIVVASEGLASSKALDRWIDQGVVSDYGREIDHRTKAVRQLALDHLQAQRFETLRDPRFPTPAGEDPIPSEADRATQPSHAAAKSSDPPASRTSSQTAWVLRPTVHGPWGR